MICYFVEMRSWRRNDSIEKSFMNYYLIKLLHNNVRAYMMKLIKYILSKLNY
jgi:hypothetical protein